MEEKFKGQAMSSSVKFFTLDSHKRKKPFVLRWFSMMQMNPAHLDPVLKSPGHT